MRLTTPPGDWTKTNQISTLPCTICLSSLSASVNSRYSDGTQGAEDSITYLDRALAYWRVSHE
jgi:hypothetical protein